MKFLVVLLAVVAVAAGYEFKEVAEYKDRSISSMVVDFLENLKTEMPCGFPGMNIPPLAPFKMTHQEFTIGGESFSFNGIVDNFRLDGLNEFDIVEFRVQAILSKVTFKFVWNHAHLDTIYEMLVKKQGGPAMNMKRNGNAKLGLKGLTVSGTMKYSLGIISNNLKVKELKVYVSVDSVDSEIEGLMKNKFMNRMINEVIEEFILLSINDNTDNIALMTDNYITPLLNSFIGDRSLSDVIGSIGGGSGGGEGGEEPVVKVPCVAPEDF